MSDYMETGVPEEIRLIAELCMEDGHDTRAIDLRIIAGYVSNLERRLAEAEAERDALKEDAERYRWIRGQRHMDIVSCWLLDAEQEDITVPEEFDAAIDAARVK